MMTLAGVAPETFVRLLSDYLKYGEDYDAIALTKRCSVDNAHEIISSAKNNGLGVHVINLQDVAVNFSSDWASVDVVNGIDNKTLKNLIRDGIKLHAALNDGRKHYQRRSCDNVNVASTNKVVLTVMVALLFTMSVFVGCGWSGPSASDVRYAMMSGRAQSVYPYNIKLIASSVKASKTKVDGVWLVVWEREGLFGSGPEKCWAYVTVHKNKKGNYVLNAIRVGNDTPPPNP